ncbi:MAG: aminoacyl-tRNA hydrolase [Pirellulales bacterium]|nr:aminoacyl-tRNA hydrolase [Pirellulales bacterium]
MKLVVGLGNPGRKYVGTRHNVGFAALDEVARRNQASKSKSNFQGELCEAEIRGEKTLLLWPQTFMNLSGGSVLAAREFYKLANTELLIICDDFNLPLAKLRLRPQGSAGGQKGLDDIIRRLGSEALPRLRIGVGPVPAGWDGAAFVLGKFTKEETTEIEIAIKTAADAVEDWVSRGMHECMNRYN